MPSPPNTVIRVEAPARLHMGFIDLDGTLGRRFGSIGLAIDRPATRIALSPRTAAHADAGDVCTLDHRVTGLETARASRALRRYAQRFAVATPLDLDICEMIPAHAGLGSGTQLAMAIGTAVARIAGMGPAPASVIGEMLARGARSAIGMAAFAHGGFLVDGGRGAADHSAPIVSRLPFPDAWRVLLVIDRQAEGVHGEKETAAFANLPPMPQATAAHLAHLTLMRLLPALAERDIDVFGDALSEIQETVGRQFAPYQGGDIWASDRVGAFLRRLADNGARGIGQSSWGPTGFAFVPTPADADRLADAHADAAARSGLELIVTKGRNTGARIEETVPAEHG